jgi:small GTP-binding protein
MDPQPFYKIIVVGASGVGKTAMIRRLVDGTFLSEGQPTVGVEFRVYECQCGSETIQLNLWDTAGQEKFRSVSKAYFRNAAGALLVFSLTDRTSFDGLESWLTDSHSLCTPNVNVLLVGNKSDLAMEREIGIEEARNFGARHGIDYMETSALDATNINESFLRLAAAIQTTALKRSSEGKVLRPPSSVRISDEQGPDPTCC